MLAACGILSRRDLTAIERGLARVGREIDRGRFKWSLEAEDVHFNIERRLTALVGEAGKRLHTARSRNDQVATDLRLWLRDEIDSIRELIAALIEALIAQAERHAALVMPGFTHLQVAQPVTFGHHLLAYVAMLERDRARLGECRARVNQLPLGAAALAGTSFPIQRERVARELGFEGLAENSIDAVSDRDFAIEFCACASLAMMHLSRLAEEIVLWSSPRFGFVRLPEGYCTGSSIMPQKKNPDVAELVRGKGARGRAPWDGSLPASLGDAAPLFGKNRRRREARAHARRLGRLARSHRRHRPRAGAQGGGARAQASVVMTERGQLTRIGKYPVL